MKDGGPAFPCGVAAGTTPDVYSHSSPGMSLRNWFAGMALRGIEIEEQADLEYAVEEAYAIADLMIVERDKSAKEE